MSVPHWKKCKRYDVPGDAHFLTFSCYRRLPLLARDRTRQWLVRGIDRARTANPFDLWGWVIMPEHVHLLILPHHDTAISPILSSIKQSVAKTFIAWLRSHAPTFLQQLEDKQPNGKLTYRFWQRGGGYDRNLRSTRNIHEKLQYIHNNPVRRQLVARRTDWYWSSAMAWQTGGSEPLAINRASFPALTPLDDRIDGALMRD